MNDLISVIVPVYNVEQYLDRCIGSIVNQTYTNLEIILVDDGSPDNCPTMCDNWAEKDCRIKVIHKQNGGLSDARNAGLAVASGEYIAFVDSDDWIHKEYIIILYNAICNNNADISACSINITNHYIEDQLVTESNCSLFDNYSVMKSLVNGKEFASNVWNKLYSSALLNNERFVVGKYHEDEFFSYKIISKVTSAVYVNTPLYFYYQRPGSIMNSFSIKRLDIFDAYTERIKFLDTNYPDLAIIDKKSFYIALVNHCCLALKFKNKDAVNTIILYSKFIKMRVKDFSLFNIKTIFYIICSKINIKLFCRILNLIHR